MPHRTVARVVSEYLTAKQAALAAGIGTLSTLRSAQLYLNAFAKDFGHLHISQCQRGDLRRFILQHPEYRSPHTKHHAAGYVVSAFRWAVEDGLIPSCPYSKPRELPALMPREPITRAEVRAILAAAARIGYRPSRRAFRCAVWFLWETGCRTSELYALDWAHYDPERGLFELPSKSTHKTGRKRTIILSRRAWRLIRFMARTAAPLTPAIGMVAVSTQPTRGPVFRNGRGDPWKRSAFSRLFRRAANAASVRPEMTAYCLRHGFCCELLAAGNGERQIADVMGHTTTKFVSWYGAGMRNRADYLRDVTERRQG